MEIVTRQDALRAGRPRFYTGRPCKRGHDSERYTLNGACVQCMYTKRMKFHNAVDVLLVFGEALSPAEKELITAIVVGWGPAALVAARQELLRRAQTAVSS